MGVAVVVFFMPVGFLYGYLATRLYIQGAIDRADGALRRDVIAMRQEVAQAKQKQADQDTVLKQISKVAAASAVQAAEPSSNPGPKTDGVKAQPLITDAA